MKFYIMLANKIIEIHSKYSLIYKMCKDYLIETPQAIDIVVCISEEDLSYERMKANIEKKIGDITHKTTYPDAYLETLSVFRKITNELLIYDTLLIHGSVIALKQTNQKLDDAYLISGKSGVGKTTHSKLWLKNLKDAYILNGDKPYFILQDEEIIVCGTPWKGKENFGINKMAKLKGICFLERGENNKIEKLDSLKALSLLIQQTYSYEQNYVQKLISLIKKLDNRVFHLSVNNFKENAWETAYKTLRG